MEILNRPATVSPMQRFDKPIATALKMWEGGLKRGQVRKPANADIV